MKCKWNIFQDTSGFWLLIESGGDRWMECIYISHRVCMILNVHHGIVPLLAGHSSLDLLNWETYSNTKPGRGAQFLSSLNKFRSTVHSNDISYKSYYIREGFQTKKRGNFGPGPKSSKSEIQKVRSSRGYQRLKYDDSFSSYEDPIT